MTLERHWENNVRWPLNILWHLVVFNSINATDADLGGVGWDSGPLAPYFVAQIVLIDTTLLCAPNPGSATVPLTYLVFNVGLDQVRDHP